MNHLLSPTAQIWRLIPPLEAGGSLQMAVDLWLLEQHRLGLHPPTLRFYRWCPVAISLGFHQKRYPAHWENLVWNDQPVELVQRPSGGRAVLHQGDLTYAVITSGFSGNRMQAYREICQFLIQGWRSLGVELTYGAAGRGYIHNPNCFGTATGADLITSGGIKLVGSAQLRQGEAILQHGSMQLTTDAGLFRQVFGTELLACNTPDPEQLISALVNAAQDCFGIQFLIKPIDQAEWSQIAANSSLESTATRRNSN